MEFQQKIEDFYGVYLLCSQSDDKKYRNKVYIGYTVNPNRRITQHNRGKAFGGAKKTDNKGPWKMVMIIHGFPNNITALQFEWAWQMPKKSSRLKMIETLKRKKNNESHFDYNFRILSEMLRLGPWNRLPLIIRWISNEYIKDFPPNKIPPMHMQITHGHVTIKKKSKSNEIDSDEMKIMNWPRSLECHLCMNIIKNPERSTITCINPKCKLTCHIICLSNLCLEHGQYLPIDGDCPICETHFLWGDLIRKKNGCNDLENYDYADNGDYDDYQEIIITSDIDDESTESDN